MIGLSIIFAYAVDLLIGDPPYPYHPVRIIGRMVQFYEARLRAAVKDELRAGFLLAFGLPIDVLVSVIFFLWVAGQLHPFIYFILSVFLIYSSLAVKDMADEASSVKESLDKGNLPEARQLLSKIVGRNTDHLDQKDVIRATVETVAEGTLDGIISPLFYAAIGGAPLTMLFKAVSTLDSMVGYQNERYEKFGRYAAKFDDLLNYLPARVSPFLVSLGSIFSGCDFLRAFWVGFRDGHKNPSPNSGFPEASFAGALNVKLGGMNYYGGKPVLKTEIGGEGKEVCPQDITKSIHLMYFSSFFAFLFALVIWYLLWRGN